jgi:sirohydrochlorin cobaltochelatase
LAAVAPNSPFCELALAGGPSHRGELLEAVTAEACQKEIGKYAAVVAEIERGIQMITGLPTVKSATTGWVGVGCDSEEMAIWLVRREGNVLFLPAAPHFTLKDQIKSIVTVTAKTWHYWNEHVAFKERMEAANGSAQIRPGSAIGSMS